MHPIIERPKRLQIFLLVWAPLSVVLAYLLGDGSQWLLALTAAVPMVLLHAMMTLSSWYTVRLFPLRKSSLSNVVLGNLVGGAGAVTVWLVAGRLLVAVVAGLFDAAWMERNFVDQLGTIFGVFLVAYMIGVLVHYLLYEIHKGRISEQRVLELQMLAKEAETASLRAQLNPHFLFNSLNSLIALIEMDSNGARELALRLADFLRESLRVGREEQIPLSREFELVSSWLAIESIRFGDRLDVAMTLDPEAADLPIVPLLLQPLVENAVRHGISTLVDGGAVEITTTSNHERLEICIENDYDPLGMSQRRTDHQGAGVGLSSVRTRLAAVYGRGGRLSITQVDGRFVATIQIDLEVLVGRSTP